MAESGQNKDVTRPWERQAGESGTAFEAFCCYRDIESNRQMTVAYATFMARLGRVQHTTKVPTHWFEWKANHNWEERVRQFDNFKARQELEDREKTYLQQVRQHVQDTRTISAAQMNISIFMLSALEKEISANPKAPFTDPNYARNVMAANRTAELATRNGKEALAIEELAKAMEHGNSGA